MATLRNLCLTLIRRTGVTAIAAARRSFAHHPAKPLALLLPKTPSPRLFSDPEPGEALHFVHRRKVL
ncbi:MAG: hypothetical protein ACRDIE_17460 [Chloroflexota bacterium]